MLRLLTSLFEVYPYRVITESYDSDIRKHKDISIAAKYANKNSYVTSHHEYNFHDRPLYHE